MMNFFCYLFIFLSIFQTQLMSRPIPRKTQSFGSGNGRMIIEIKLQRYPPAAFALVAIGDPPVKAALHIDTGIDLTWVQHKPGSGYDPLRSSSFNLRSCVGFKFGVLTPSRRRGQCDYKIRLGDDSMYKGTIGEETFKFETGDMGVGMLNNVLFGFGGTIDGPQVGTGTLGLNMDQLSIITRSVISKQFSMCIGSFSNIGGGKHFLALGDDTVLDGMKVPLIDSISKNYKIKITSVEINGEVIDILSNTDSTVDTGTSSLICLVPEAYKVFVGMIEKNMIRQERYIDPDENDSLCYSGKVPEDGGVGVSLKFGKVTMKFLTSKLFNQIEDDIFCLAVDKMPGNIKVNIIGIAAFQGYNVGFDIPNSQLHLKSVDCHKLYDDDFKDDELSLPTP